MELTAIVLATALLLELTLVWVLVMVAIAGAAASAGLESAAVAGPPSRISPVSESWP